MLRKGELDEEVYREKRRTSFSGQTVSKVGISNAGLIW
jgi:hypothetical protein